MGFFVSTSTSPADFIAAKARFTRPWYSFSHKDCLFIVLESDVILGRRERGYVQKHRTKCGTWTRR